MIYYEDVQVWEKSVKSKECNKCHKKYDAVNDVFEIQEFLHFRNTGGYGSIFGDGAEIKLDLCQHCVKELLGPYLQIGPDWIKKEMEKEERRNEKNV